MTGPARPDETERASRLASHATASFPAASSRAWRTLPLAVLSVMAAPIFAHGCHRDIDDEPAVVPMKARGEADRGR
jgi:hypothetical protein